MSFDYNRPEGQWSREDEEAAIKQQNKEVFRSLVPRYFCLEVIEESIARLEQESAIMADLSADKPVLIRGNPRMGKSSMALALRHHFTHAIHESIDTIFYTDLETFKKELCFGEIAELITNIDTGTSDFQKSEKIREDMQNSGKPSFEFPQEHLEKKGITVFVTLDEIISQKTRPEVMKYLASLANLKNIKIAMVLHHFDSLEESWAEIFAGFSTHTITSISIEETGKMVHRYLPKKEGDDTTAQIEFDEAAVRKIWEFTGGRPIEINLVCAVLFNPRSRFFTGKRQYGASELEPLIDADFWDLVRLNDFEVPINNHKRVFQTTINDLQRSLIKQLINEGKIDEGTIDDATKKSLEKLIELSWVRKENGAYLLHGILFGKTLKNFELLST